MQRFNGEDAAAKETNPKCTEEEWQAACAKIAAMPEEKTLRKIGKVILEDRLRFGNTVWWAWL